MGILKLMARHASEYVCNLIEHNTKYINRVNIFTTIYSKIYNDISHKICTIIS